MVVVRIDLSQGEVITIINHILQFELKRKWRGIMCGRGMRLVCEDVGNC